MYIHPRPPYPNAPAPDVLTQRRLWFLFCLARFNIEQVALLTGATPSEIRQAVSRWGLTRTTLIHPTALDQEVIRAVLSHLGPELINQIPSDKWLDISFSRRSLREAFVEGRISWQAIDALPPVVELVPLRGKDT
jgi:hypothetical protein